MIHLGQRGAATVGGPSITHLGSAAVQRAIQLGRAVGPEHLGPHSEKDYRNESSQGLYRESETE
jgi:hypothetical protein